ncbi:putative sulfate exporter family transporter [Escherichia coli]|uniref:putative sulfate exporter family transporter n=1 Tax=Escherichia coli TaxID=562 RepID=UPI00070DA415|nr:putative sulfate exporter family transporter [Escherichia coli]
MTNITLQKQHRTLWHFIPGLALSAVITGVALWGGSIPAVAGAGFSALTLAILLGMVLGNTIYPHIWKSCDGGVLFAKQYLLRLGIILYGFRLTFSQIADVGISGIIIDVLTLSSTFLLAMAMAALGLTTHVSALKKAGAKPLLMALVLFAWLIVGGGAINYVIQSVIA